MDWMTWRLHHQPLINGRGWPAFADFLFCGAAPCHSLFGSWRRVSRRRSPRGKGKLTAEPRRCGSVETGLRKSDGVVNGVTLRVAACELEHGASWLIVSVPGFFKLISHGFQNVGFANVRRMSTYPIMSGYELELIVHFCQRPRSRSDSGKARHTTSRGMCGRDGSLPRCRFSGLWLGCVLLVGRAPHQ